MTTPTDPRAAAEEALRLHDGTEWRAVYQHEGDLVIEDGSCNTRPLSADDYTWIRRARTLLPILARAVIDGLAERDTMRNTLTAIGFPRQDDESLTDTFERAWGWSVEMAHKAQASADAARAELASLRGALDWLRSAHRADIIEESGVDSLYADRFTAETMVRAVENRAAKLSTSRRAIPPEIRALVTAARDLSDAALDCDVEAERPSPSQSSAPLVRQINAMARLRTALAAIPPEVRTSTDAQKEE